MLNIKKSIFTLFRPRIRSRHPSHNVLRPINKTLPLLPFRSVIRFGSSTVMSSTITNGGDRVELNTVQAIKNSANKLMMKKCFDNNGVITATWWTHNTCLHFKSNLNEDVYVKDLSYPIISKHIYGSRGTGNVKHDNDESLQQWMKGKDLNNYIFEKYYSYNREYRLHVSKNGAFYSCRKMLKSDAPEEVRWYRNDDYCVWILEENESFDKPSNWDKVVEESVKALHSVGLDFGAIDLRIQSSKDKDGELREDPKFIIVEINSAPSFGEKTSNEYIKELPKLLVDKYNNI
jgi:glutathione synthase/RimK-type ligase-like ATP-grasp enzyme